MKKMTIRQFAIGCGCLFSSCFLGAAAAYAGDSELTVIFPVPTSSMNFPENIYCFDKTNFRGGLANATLDHAMVIPGSDQLKTGDVFVGFRLKSNPDVVLLKSSFPDHWSSYDGTGEPVAYQANISLLPVSLINIIKQPVDLRAYAGDGEVLVGYGLRTGPDATLKDSFQDMLANRRYSVIWHLDPQSHVQSLCLHVTGLHYDQTMATQ